MTVLRLTQRRVDSIKPRTRQFTIRDTQLRGFGVRILTSGAKRYFVHSQYEGHRVWKDIGDAATVALADARTHAVSVLTSHVGVSSVRPPGKRSSPTQAPFFMSPIRYSVSVVSLLWPM